MTRWLVCVGLLALTGCDFSGRLATFCQNQGTCACDQGNCCITAGNACEAGLCCDGLTCPEDGVCHAVVAALSARYGATTFPEVAPGATDATEVQITNHGYGPSEPLVLSLTGDVDQFRIVGGSCSGQRLAVTATCGAQVVFAPTRGGDFHVELQVSGGGDPLRVPFEGLSQTPVWVIHYPPLANEITVDSTDFRCGPEDGSCTAVLPDGQATFRETHGAGTQFLGWRYCVLDPWATCIQTHLECGTAPTCTVPIAPRTEVWASYEPFLTIDHSIAFGWLTSDPPGLDCGDGPSHLQCQAALAGPVRLIATPAPGHVFRGWVKTYGPCDDAVTNECDLNLTGPVGEIDPSFD